MSVEADSYRVEILHYLNPHLLWVEVVNTKSEDFIFEQIGVYGVIPQEVTLNDITHEVETLRCEQWTPAAFLAMKKVISDAHELWFSPIHIDRRSSIFDDNIHKYGEIVVRKKDGKFKALTQQLIKSGFALYDTGLFHQYLSAGNLKTKLNSKQKQEIIKQLVKANDKPRKEWEQAVKTKTKILHKAQTLESMLTVDNLHQHEKVQELLKNKLKDLDRCKDSNEDSVGRAISRQGSLLKTTQDVQPSLSKKKLELLKKKTNISPPKHDTERILVATKKFLEQNAIIKDMSEVSDNVVPVHSYNGYRADVDNNNAISSEITNPDCKDQINFRKQSSKIYKPTDSNHITDVDSSDNRESVILDNSKNKSRFLENSTTANAALPSPVRVTKLKKKPKSPKIPEYDINNEKRIAFGPPGLDRHKLSVKVVPKSTLEDDLNLESKVSVNVEELDTTHSRDVFEGLDSELNVEITNKNILDKFKIELKSINTSNDITYNKLKENSSTPHRRVEKHQEELNIENSNTSDNISQTDYSTGPKTKLRSKFLQKKLKLQRESKITCDDSLSSSDIAKDSSTSIEDEKRENCCESDENIEDILQKLNLEYCASSSVKKGAANEEPKQLIATELKNNVNPFKNIDSTISVFVDKLVTPVLMVHTKMNKRIQPCMELRDVNFNTNIHIALANMLVKHPKMIQSVTWQTILRGYSLFMVSPLDSGKTMGYLPAVCRLVTDFKTDTLDNEGPSCIIVCATAKAASEVERISRMFLGLKERVLTCYTGMNELHVTTALLNGCDLLICTPSILVRLMQVTEFGVDLRRLATFVLDDCERLSEVYMNEVKFFLIKIKKMLKSRANKELKVQIIAASRIWCDFMGPLARKAPNSVVCIGAFQECVLYSKANTTVNFVKKENKIELVMEFLKQVDGPKKTVIVCRDDNEVEVLEKCLLKHGKVVFACNNTMTVQDLYVHSKNWADYQEPILGPILVCCDGNLIHLNVTNAHYLVHFSLPHLFSTFCKRFAVLNDNYASIFKPDDVSDVKIKVLLEDNNVEQLPKILNFIKRCTDEIPQFLNDVSTKILAEKDEIKARNLVPVCDNLLSIGECPDYWNCKERHAIIKQYDESADWMPKTGVVTFKILHYHTAVLYSVRLLSNIVNGYAIKYPQTYSTLSLKMGMYYSKESNKKLHGLPKVGDVCAVAVKTIFFARCQVMKILSHYKNGSPNYVLIKLIDEEKYERCSDVHLYYLPDELKAIETHIIRVRLANIKPKDKDVTFSDLATSQLKKITYKQDLYLRGKVSLAIGNCVLVDTMEACQDLTSLNETVVNEDFRKILLDTHAIPNPEHIPKLESLCREGELVLDVDKKVVENFKPVKEEIKPNWAHLDHDTQCVFFATAETPDTFFIRLAKFESCMKILLLDIEKYVKENPEPLIAVKKGDFVLAKFPLDGVYERARIDEVYDEHRVKCFFVDQGDWGDILLKDLVEIPQKFLTQMPCQAIECRLAGVLPASDNWAEFGTHWFTDTCLEDDDGNIKQLYVKYFTKEVATHTDGHKYGVVLIDTNGDYDVVINQLMIDKNFAQENPEEIKYLEESNLNKPESTAARNTDEEWENIEKEEIDEVEKEEAAPKESLDKMFLKKPIRSVPLVEDDDDDDKNKWDVNMASEFITAFGLAKKSQNITEVEETKPAVNNVPVAKSNQVLTHIKDNATNSVVNKEFKNELLVESIKETQKSEQVTNTAKEITPTNNAEEKLVKNKRLNDTLDSDDLSSSESSITFSKIQQNCQIKDHKRVDELSKPKLIWRQNNSSVIIKIQLIGVESYDLEIGDRSVKFEANANDTKYGFHIELYGVIDRKSYYHSNKGQYILIHLKKVLNKRWLTLTRDVGLKKWIVYDVDSIDTSSDEEGVDEETIKNVVKNMRDSDTDSDDEFVDDSKF